MNRKVMIRLIVAIGAVVLSLFLFQRIMNLGWMSIGLAVIVGAAIDFTLRLLWKGQ